MHFGYHVGSKTLSSNVVYVYADKETEMCLNLVTLTVVQLIYNSSSKPQNFETYWLAQYSATGHLTN